VGYTSGLALPKKAGQQLRERADNLATPRNHTTIKIK